MSYARQDDADGEVASWVGRLREALPADIAVFQDVGIQPGRAWADEIARALEESHVLLALVSPNSETRPHCVAEVWFFHARMVPDRLLVPIRWRGGDPGSASAMGIVERYQRPSTTDPGHIAARILEHVGQLEAKRASVSLDIRTMVLFLTGIVSAAFTVVFVMWWWIR